MGLSFVGAVATARDKQSKHTEIARYRLHTSQSTTHFASPHLCAGKIEIMKTNQRRCSLVCVHVASAGASLVRFTIFPLIA